MPTCCGRGGARLDGRLHGALPPAPVAPASLARSCPFRSPAPVHVTGVKCAAQGDVVRCRVIVSRWWCARSRSYRLFYPLRRMDPGRHMPFLGDVSRLVVAAGGVVVAVRAKNGVGG